MQDFPSPSRPPDVPPAAAAAQPPMRRRGHRLSIAAAAAVWILGIAFGARALQRFEGTPGAVGATPAEWPAGSALIPDARRMTLVMLIHPQCSCTRASLTELAEVMQRAQGRVDARVLFVQPPDAAHSATWQAAARLPGVRVGVDPTGAEAVRFGALTSGFVVLYDGSRRLRFAGGITGARGHAGANTGRDQLLAAVDLASQDPRRHAVFGCSLDASAPRLLPAPAAPAPASATAPAPASG